MNEFQITNVDGKFYADSREVAEKIERPHNDIQISLDKMSIDEKKDLICLLDLLISVQGTQAPQGGFRG